jgi:deoxyribodipyrimidine photo-lyase
MNIFIFHRDLRLHDNTALIAQAKLYGPITPVFIFTEQVDKKANDYFSNNAVQFMCESLLELADDIKSKGGKLYFFKGNTISILNKLNKEYDIKSIAHNLDYTPYARKRDAEIQEFCKKYKIDLVEREDYALYDIIPGQTTKSDKTPYLVFTPFKKHCMANLEVRHVDTFNKFTFNLFKLAPNTFKDISSLYTENKQLNTKPGRKAALSILNRLDEFKDYKSKRDFLTYKTTFLSAHNHFSTVSCREVYHKMVEKLGKSSGLINEMHWRDFYMNITFHFPRILKGQITNGKDSKSQVTNGKDSKSQVTNGKDSKSQVTNGKDSKSQVRDSKSHNQSFKSQYDKIKWDKSSTADKRFDAWCKGETGFPIIDACMRQLNTTGYMHNRGRMIVASFLTKDLHIDWRWGEQYFATKLVDYDPMSNSGGWQWASSVGTDAQPYYRIFNPWTQSEKYDAKAEYIKKWVPELVNLEPKEIHKWYKVYDNDELYDNISKRANSYPKPIIDHDEERLRTLKIFKDIK